MKTRIEIRAMIASLFVLGMVVLSAALLVSAQVGSDTKKAKKEPPPLNTAPYEIWSMESTRGSKLATRAAWR